MTPPARRRRREQAPGREARGSDPAGSGARPASPSTATTVAVGLGAYLVAVLLLIAIASYTYGFFAVTDIGYYRNLADRVALGLRPYVDFPVEYPPLAITLMTAAHLRGVPYQLAFAGEMFLFGAAAAGAVALASARLWTGVVRLVAPLAFAGGVLAAGAIVANRFDTAVAFLIAASLWLLVSRQHVAAAAVLGVGFALKLTPALLLPVVVVLARRRWAAIGAFCVAASVPFLAHLGAPHLARIVLYHAERPLQFESVLATPLLLSHLLGLTHAQIGNAYGSQMVVAPGAELLTALSAPLGIAALCSTYALVLARRAAIGPEDVALPVLAVLLTFVVFGKVLSPQFLVWLLPVAALLAPRRPLLAGLFLGIVALTQVEFPSLFRALVALRAEAIAVVALRNAALVALWVLVLVELWRLPRGARESAPREGAVTAAGQRAS